MSKSIQVSELREILNNLSSEFNESEIFIWPNPNDDTDEKDKCLYFIFDSAPKKESWISQLEIGNGKILWRKEE